MTTPTSGPALPGSSVQALRDLIAESRSLREDIDLDRRLWKQRIRVGLALIVVVVLMIGGLLTIVVQNRFRSNQNAEILRQQVHLNQQIADCTTEGGKCSQRGAQRTGEAIAELARLQIAIDLCGREPDNDTMPEMERCVAARSKAAKSGR